MRRRVLLLVPTTTYKAPDLMAAAEALDVEVVVASDRRQALEREVPGRTLTLDFSRPARCAGQIEVFARREPLEAVIGVDDETVEVAAHAAAALGLPHNPPDAARDSRDKLRTRERLAAAGMRGPRFRVVPLDEGPERAAADVSYPCVLKPRFLSMSRGVLRADDAQSFCAAFERIAALLGRAEVRRRGGRAATGILVEDYLPGVEVALEGLLERGAFRVLAVFDKPDPLEGPIFEETIYVTPSRLPDTVQRAAAAETARACRALGLREGPLHAELRIRDGEPWVLEVAARSIGGLCARALRFGAGVSLEELILRHALGLDAAMERERRAAGVMMIPIPRRGVLRGVDGLPEARAVPGIEDVTLTLHVGADVVPLPEGHRYLGFLFARGDDPAFVEGALRRAHSRLAFDIQ